MQFLYHVSCKGSPARLYQLADGTFQIMEDGEITPLMVGFEYVLIDSAFAEYIEELELVGVHIADATIYDPRRKEEIRSYKQLKIDQRFSSGMIRDLDLEGERFLLMDDTYLFVSPDLRRRLESSPFRYLQFTEGLSEFAV